jgi:hypothetical protein
MRSIWSLLLVLMLSPSAHAAEHDWPASPRTEGADHHLSVSLTDRTGLATAPFITTAFPEVSGFVTVLTPALAYRLFTLGWLRAQLPTAYVRLDLPARAQVGETALGNLELSLEHPLELQGPTHLGLGAAIFAPTAAHGPEGSLFDSRALALADALNGGKNSALFTPGIIGLRLGTSLEHSAAPFAFRAALDLPLLVRISDASLPAETDTHRVGLLPTLSLSAAWWLEPWLAVRLGTTLVTEPWRVQEPTRAGDRDSRLQAVVEPGVHAQLGQRFALGLDASLPVAGALGGDAWSIGLRCRFEL